VKLRIPWRTSPWATAAAIYAAVFIVGQQMPWWTAGGTTQVVSNAAILPFNFAFVLAFWQTARRKGLDPHLALAFRLLAIGEAVVVFGDLGSVAMVLLAHRDPTWSWPNVPYLLYYPFTVAAYLSMPRARRDRLESWKLGLDTTIVVIGSAVAIWHVVLRAGAARAAVYHPVIALAFPIADLVLLFSVTTVALRPPGGRYTPALMLLLGGQVLSVIGDLLYTLVVSIWPTQAQLWGDAMYAVSYVVLLASVDRYRRTADGVLEPTTGVMPAAGPYESPVPYAAALAVYGLLFWVAMRQSHSELGLLAAGATPVTVLLTVRGIITGRQSARLLAERATRASEARFRALVQNARDAILIADSEGLIHFASPAAQRVLGIAPDALGDVALRTLALPADELVVAALLTDVRLAPDRVAAADWRARHADGSVRHLETVVTNLTHEPAVGGLVVNIRDVTERQLLQERLEHAQRLEAVGQLAGGVAHDFNNIMTAISGNAELALEDLGNTSSAAESLAEIRTAAARASALTRQLLAFSRKQVMRAQRLDANAVITGCGRMLTRLIGEDIALDLRLAPDLPAIVADPVQLEQVFVNLIVNARDAMPTGGSVRIETGVVSISSVQAREWPGLLPGQYVRIAVRDTGVGMDEATRARVFEPFFTTKGPGQGTGLGLSTVYGIVKQTGGYIYVTSASGMGSTFTMYFTPDAQAPTATHATPHAGVASLALAPDASAPLHGATVLVVEDEPAVRAAIAQALARQGVNILQATDGADGLAVAARYSGPIDLVVSDVVMPHLTGPAMFERMRRVRPGVRALFVSGYAAPQLRHRLTATAAAVLEKPFTLSELTTRVRGLLAERA
jgi:PAS domain S-box-containing protein